jgi:hypothetical protein
LFPADTANLRGLNFFVYLRDLREIGLYFLSRLCSLHPYALKRLKCKQFRFEVNKKAPDPKYQVLALEQLLA